ncbi:MAG: sigma 54-interacting transcriptional regulator [Deltaproteobacteria bacterium]|nr:sigma 54-interacting transcriptional regulator [Deltaproteobacteria bacterium]
MNNEPARKKPNHVRSEKKKHLPLLASRKTISNILECTPIAQFSIGMDHRITQWNKTCELLTGYSAKEMIGTRRQWEPFYPNERPVLADLIVDNDFKYFQKSYIKKSAAKSKIISQAWQATDSFENLGDKSRHLFFIAAPIIDSKSKIIGAVETLQDITKKIRAKENLRASEERYRVLTEQIADGVVLIQDGKVRFINDAGAKIFGYHASDDIIGNDMVNLISGQYKKNFKEMKKAFDKGRSSEKMRQLQCLKKDGSKFWVEAHSSVIKWEGKPALLTTVRDITTAKLQDLAIRKEAYCLRGQNERLKSTIKGRYSLGRLIGKSEAMQEVYDRILKAASSNANVVIYGDSGTGKELVARAIHDMSDRGNREFIAVNCGAIPENLIEREFFGHKKGAFTGAVLDKSGYLESADGGTLFLYEVGEIPLNMQVKLLRAAEDGSFTPIGSTREKKTNIRIIAATHRNLKDRVKNGLMREDFFYRIHIIPIHIPPLRERKDDLPLLVYHFLQTFSDNGKTTFISEKVLKAIQKYDWPGNIRELQNAIHRYITFNTMDFLEINPTEQHDSIDYERDLFPNAFEEFDLRVAMENFEKRVIVNTLKQNQGNRTRAAKALGIERRSLQRKLKRYRIT